MPGGAMKKCYWNTHIFEKNSFYFIPIYQPLGQDMTQGQFLNEV